MHPAPVDIAVLEHVGVIGGVLFGPGPQGEGRGIFQQLQPAARHREWCAAGLADDPFAVIDQTRHAGVFPSGLAYRVTDAKIPVRGIHRHFVGGRVQFEQGFLPVRQGVTVLRDVLRGDHKQRFFVRVRIHGVVPRTFEINMGRRAQPLATERRDTAIGIAGLFRAQARQVFAKARDVLRCCVCGADGTASK